MEGDAPGGDSRRLQQHIPVRQQSCQTNRDHLSVLDRHLPGFRQDDILQDLRSKAMLETKSASRLPFAWELATYPGWIAWSCSTRKLGPTFGIAQRSKKNRANAWEKTGVFPVCSRLRINMSTVLVKGVMTELIPERRSAFIRRCLGK